MKSILQLNLIKQFNILLFCNLCTNSDINVRYLCKILKIFQIRLAKITAHKYRLINLKMTKYTYRYCISKGCRYWCSGDEYDSENSLNLNDISYIRGEEKSRGGPPPWCRSAEDRRAHEEWRAFRAEQQVLYAERRARKRKKRVQERKRKKEEQEKKKKLKTEMDHVSTTEEESVPSTNNT